MKKNENKTDKVVKANSKPIIRNEFSTGIARSIIGYCWPWTVRPGESLDFMVSTYGDKAEQAYQADLVRVFCGDAVIEGSLKEIELQAPFSREYAGRHQPSYPGSYVEVAENGVLNSLESFTVQTFLWPSLLHQQGAVGMNIGLGIVVESESGLNSQTLVSRFDNENQMGWSLYIDANDKLVFKVGEGKGAVQIVSLSQPLVQDRWFQVSGQYDAVKRKLVVSAEPIIDSSGRELAWSAETAETGLPSGMQVPQQGPLRFGAATGGAGNGGRRIPVNVLNGKLDSVRLARGVHGPVDIKRFFALKSPQEMMSDIIGCWDFAEGIGTTTVHDLSSNQLHGTAVNMPDRAVVGVHWDRKMGSDWRYAKDSYSACHFHDDDLYDAEWQADFSYQVPKELASGVYAARLRHGDFEDHIPFFVAPAKNQPSSKAAFLMPTLSYTAYTNVDLGYIAFRQREIRQADGSCEVIKEKLFPHLVGKKEEGEFMACHPELGKGTYRFHSDGSQCRHSSQKHPNMTLQLQSGYTKLAVDLYITDLLQSSGLEVDIITDDLLHEEGVDLLNDYRVVMTGHHPEYSTHAMTDALEQYLDDGGRWMYLGGNGYFWVTSPYRELPGALEVRRPVEFYATRYWNQSEMVNEFDGADGGVSWHANRPPHAVVGIGMDGNMHCLGVPYYRKPSADDPRASFVFEGVEEQVIGDFGLYPGGAAGMEIDAYRPEFGSPAHALILATSGEFEYPFLMPDGSAAEEYRLNYRMPCADMVFFETSNGGAVFSVGSMAWAFSLNHNNHENNVAHITLNVLRRFMDSKPFEMPAIEKT